MPPNLHARPALRPALLVSVRDAAEAKAALLGGADIIDVKEPRTGPLGRAERHVIDEITAGVAGQVPVTAAAGELGDLTPEELQAWHTGSSLQLVKFGLAGAPPQWTDRWRQVLTAIGDASIGVPVAYADWQKAGAPSPDEVAETAAASGCRWLLVDTFCKESPGLLGNWSLEQITTSLAKWRRLGLEIALAGRLSATDLENLTPLAPSVLGVRGAACVDGRASAINAQRVASLRQAIATAKTEA